MTSLCSTPAIALPHAAHPSLDVPTGDTGAGPEWRVSPGLVAYPEALAAMEARVAAVAAGTASELVWLLEHPPLYTAGTSARPEHLLTPERFPVYQAGRGGQFTYHGPGQRIAYLVLDLKTRGCDIRRFVHDLEEWLIRTLTRFDICGERRPGRIGVWVALGGGHEAKIAALGVRVRRWVSLHGVALNVAPDLSHYQGIVPCGISEHGVTSLHALGRRATLDEVDAALAATWPLVFGRRATPPRSGGTPPD